MTTESLIKILGDLNQLENVTLEELISLKDQFPYSQNFQLLVAKKKQLLGRDDSDEAFHNVTNYIVNKNHLYERFAESEAESPLANQQSSSLDKLIEDELFGEQKTEDEASEKTAPKSTDSESKKEKELQEEISKPASLPEETIEASKEPEFISVSDIEDKVVIPGERTAEDMKNSFPEISDNEISDNEITEDDDLDFITVKPVKLPKNKAKKDKKKTNKTKKANDKMTNKKKKEKREKKKKKALESSEKKRRKLAKENKKKLKKQREEKAKEIFTENLDSFTSWLASLSPSKNLDLAHEDRSPKSSKPEVESKKPHSKVKKKKKKKKKKLQNKIDSSQQRKSAVVSETLAEIMANQGHIKQSIDIYKQLMLLYPEKSGYFASQIKKLD